MYSPGLDTLDACIDRLSGGCDWSTAQMPTDELPVWSASGHGFGIIGGYEVNHCPCVLCGVANGECSLCGVPYQGSLFRVLGGPPGEMVLAE